MVQLKGKVTLTHSALAQVYLNLLFTISSYKPTTQKSLHARFRMEVFVKVYYFTKSMTLRTKRYTILVRNSPSPTLVFV